MKKSILIVGAGIGGLTSKLLLDSLGYEVFLAEKNSEFSTDGAGLLLAVNVIKIFKEMGLEKEVLRKSQVLDELITAKYDGTMIDRIDFKKIYDKTKLLTIAIHRLGKSNEI